MDRLVWSGWNNMQRKNWRLSVDLMRKSVKSCPLDETTLRSRNGILSLLVSCVNLRLESNLLSFSKNESSFSCLWVQMKNTSSISSIYQNQTKGFNTCFWKNIIFTLAMNIQTQCEANFVPIIVLEVHYLTLALNSK